MIMNNSETINAELSRGFGGFDVSSSAVGGIN